MSVGKKSSSYLIGILIIALASFGVAMIAYARNRAESREARERKAEVAAGPFVQVIAATPAKREQKLELQAEARPFAEVTLYSKISGYLRVISVDKGDAVKENQLIAVIQSPELDRQYEGARADADYKRNNAKRSETLAKGGFIAPRDAELDVSQAAMAESSVASLVSQKAYEQLRAPFAGTVTARYADPGALVQSAANAQTSALPVVTIAQIDRLRVYAYVDQRAAPLIHPGTPAEISLPGAATGSDAIKGDVTRIARELDPRTRMMLCEVDIDNKEGRIVSGSFVTVTLTVAAAPAVEIPVEALILRDRKPYVAKVSGTQDSRVSLHEITLAASAGRGSDGVNLRVATGLHAGELVALNLGDTIVDGSPIRAVVRTPPPTR